MVTYRHPVTTPCVGTWSVGIGATALSTPVHPRTPNQPPWVTSRTPSTDVETGEVLYLGLPPFWWEGTSFREGPVKVTGGTQRRQGPRGRPDVCVVGEGEN